MIGWTDWIWAYGTTLFACVVVPVLGMALLVPTLRQSRLLVTNYRGVALPPGLGIVWVWWVAGLVVLVVLLGVVNGVVADRPIQPSGPIGDFAAVLSLAGIVVVPAFVFGMIDDVFGGADKGFRGHVSAILHGRLTTGMLKLIGIGVAALLGGMALSGDISNGWPLIVMIGLRAAVIALAANAVNLLDLRPGRALKAYLAAATVVVVSVPLVVEGPAAEGFALAGLVVLALAGPALAVWRYDVGEVGMLGDGGANPAGALVGVFFAALWPPLPLAVLAVALLALNLASERVSFSRVIEGNGLLRWIDSLGRGRRAEGTERGED